MTSIERPARTLDDYSKIYVYKNDPKLIGQGINAAYIQSYEGAYIPFISEKSYIDRKSKVISYDNKTSHGTRPLHQTTFEQHKDLNSKNDYTTNHKNVYQGFQNSARSRAKTSQNQFRHQFKFGYENEKNFSTGYRNEFMPKTNKEFAELKQKNHENYLRNSKSEVKDLIEVNKNDSSYWTQYKRIHDYLGHLRGPGVSREYQDRRALNVLTGELIKPSWSTNTNYKRVSGNVILHNERKNHKNILN